MKKLNFTPVIGLLSLGLLITNSCESEPMSKSTDDGELSEVTDPSQDDSSSDDLYDGYLGGSYDRNGVHRIYIDMGLPSGNRWAFYSIGQPDPGPADVVLKGTGEFYAWGETKTKDSYTWGNYIHSEIIADHNDVLVNNIGDNISGTQYDVAQTLWGERWQLPTRADFEELIDNCTFEIHTDYSGYEELTVRGPNGGCIFLRIRDCEAVAGPLKEGVRFLAQYWTGESVPVTYNAVDGDAQPATGPCAYAFEIDEYGYRIVDDVPKYQGCFVHPVIKRKG